MDAIRKARSLLFGSALILTAVGVIMIYSASGIYAYETMKDSAYFLKRHLIYLALGGVLARMAASADIPRLRRHSKAVLITAISLLVLVLIPHVGASTGGARRWFKVLGFSFQPSEFLKLAMIFYMADFLDRKRGTFDDLKRTVVPAFFVIGLAAGLVFLQPDLGTAVTVAFVCFTMFFVAGFRVRHLLTVILAALPALAFAMLAKPYRRRRLLAFFHPWDDPRGVGFQIVQSFLALGSGGIFGVGLGRSQQKLFYLPESHTDFIFSIIGEELGFLGTSSVALLFTVFIFAGMVVAFKAKDYFSQLLALGLVTLVGLEAVINIGVSTGALPTKGLSLPFISYGGSALLANLVAVGFLLNIARHASAPEDGAGAP
ncbi:MAG TPA: putative lipid II flippase FtsW [Candidatus Eisenbacteria bacterium]|nr:putative lipid II flippase FtsW [Candidatus Eisenbacteria bacterium]